MTKEDYTSTDSDWGTSANRHVESQNAPPAPQQGGHKPLVQFAQQTHTPSPPPGPDFGQGSPNATEGK